jgi:hypothetical protein
MAEAEQGAFAPNDPAVVPAVDSLSADATFVAKVTSVLLEDTCPVSDILVSLRAQVHREITELMDGAPDMPPPSLPGGEPDEDVDVDDGARAAASMPRRLMSRRTRCR